MCAFAAVSLRAEESGAAGEGVIFLFALGWISAKLRALLNRVGFMPDVWAGRWLLQERGWLALIP